MPLKGFHVYVFCRPDHKDLEAGWVCSIKLSGQETVVGFPHVGCLYQEFGVKHVIRLSRSK